MTVDAFGSILVIATAVAYLYDPDARAYKPVIDPICGALSGLMLIGLSSNVIRSEWARLAKLLTKVPTEEGHGQHGHGHGQCEQGRHGHGLAPVDEGHGQCGEHGHGVHALQNL